MENDVKQKNESEHSQGDTGVAVRQVPVLLLMLALLSLAFLGLAATAIASTEQLPPPTPPMLLPADASTSGEGSAESEAKRWILGAQAGRATRRIAGRAGADPVSHQDGIYSVPRAEATEFAAKLERRGTLRFAEPDVPVIRSSYPNDLFAGDQWWLDRIVDTTDITPPPVVPNSPRLALVEESVDPLHPDLIEASLGNAKSIGPSEDWHGTAVAGIAGSPGEGRGIRGVWPGMNMVIFPSGKTCATTSKAVLTAARSRAAAINMSYGFPADVCFSHYVATETAVRKGVLPVASSGNSFVNGANSPMRPAIDPHVISVSAIDESGQVAGFATRNSGVDITAPGASILAPSVAVGASDLGVSEVERFWARLNGTSFSAPMVAAAATWLRQERPRLKASQIGRLLTNSATDLGPAGRDPEYGEGLLDIGSALSSKAPPRDRKEPNDDIPWVDGSLMKGRAGFLWKPSKGRRKSITATLARVKDPADVYRVRIPPRRKILITAAQFQGDIELTIFGPKTETINDSSVSPVVDSDRARPKTEGVRIKNRKRKPQLAYVAVTVSPRDSGDYSRYKLSVKRRGPA